MSIQFLLDENMPYALIDFLESRGFTATHLKRIGKGGIRNGEVYEFAEKNKMWIITRHADFQNIKKFNNYNEISDLDAYHKAKEEVLFIIENNLMRSHFLR
ncbi:MAG: DUF5615 family PIN-like protein [Candidatus Kuenenia sp.]|nr:DUF5615 family PIN-like protein [Candidatus Kuenenia hertensis]